MKTRQFKHKFILVDSSEVETEIATCLDEMTTNFLSDHFRSVYEGNKNGLRVIHRFKGQENLIA